jgi:hypothetical protein
VRSRGKNTRSASPEQAAVSAKAPAALQVAANGQTGPRGPLAANDETAPGGLQAAAPSARRPAGDRRALKNWRVRSRLLLLVAIPTLTAVVLGGTRIASAAQSASTYQRVAGLANLSQKITGLVEALQVEREDTTTFIVLNLAGGRQAALTPHAKGATSATLAQGLLRHDYAATDQLASQVRAVTAGIGSSYPELIQNEAQNVTASVDSLKALRQQATTTHLPSLTVVQEYSSAISEMLALDDQVASGSNDSTLADNVRVLGLISRMKEDVSEQQALLNSGLNSDLVSFNKASFGASELSAITAAQADQQSNLAQFNLAASADQRQVFNNAQSAGIVGVAQAQEQQAIALASNPNSQATDPVVADATAAASYTISGMRTVEQKLVSSIISRSTSLRDGAITSGAIDGIAVLLVLALALLFTTVVGRSMTRPLQRLRTGALEVAGVRLPEAVRQMSESENQTAVLDVEPINVDSSDEIGEVARAFDQVHREALRLASNEAALRGNVNAMFVNLSRRSQSLVERQIRLIDDLEQGEQDAERLGNLFQLDHLATRMRRNSENLLVLAGHDLARRWNQPVALVDVLRAAVSEIEQYERVSLNVQPGIAVRGAAVNDVVHLLAELAENATSLSSADTPVNIAGHLLTSGGVLLDITDQGVGMGAEEMAHANWRLDNPPVVDVAVSRRMGLFVVGRLAARHGIRVRLRPAASGGLTALVWLPDEVITNEVPGSTPAPATFETADSGSLEAELAGLGRDGGWVDPGRSAAEQEVTAARTPKFAPLRVEADSSDTGLGPRRVPGAGVRGGGPAWSSTGPLPVFQEEGPLPAGERSGSGPPTIFSSHGADTAQLPAVGGGNAEVPEQASAAGSGPRPGGGASSDLFGPATRAGNGGAAASSSAAGAVPGVSSPSAASLGSGTPAGGRDDASELTGAGAPLGAPAAYSWQSGQANGGVIVPPAESLADENRLPIFEAVESDWFRRGRSAFSWSGKSGSEPERSSWTSPSDEGWRAAEIVSAPSSSGVTAAGLPKRVPQANLVPGAAAAAAAPSPARSAAVTRERFASFQRGVREAKAAAASGGAESAGDDETS